MSAIMLKTLTMSADSIKLYYANFNAGNWTAMLELVDDNIRHEPNQGEPRIGKALFTEFLAKMDRCYQEQLTDLTFLSDASGTRFAVEFTVNGIYKEAEEGMPEAHGQTYVLPAAAFLEVHNGKITRVTTYYNLELWISLVSA